MKIKKVILTVVGIVVGLCIELMLIKITGMIWEGRQAYDMFGRINVIACIGLLIINMVIKKIRQ